LAGQISARRTIGENHGPILSNPSSGNRQIALAQANQQVDFLTTSHEQKNTPGADAFNVIRRLPW
jgi:hypothetical protein